MSLGGREGGSVMAVESVDAEVRIEAFSDELVVLALEERAS